jgi:hypothetical protein
VECVVRKLAREAVIFCLLGTVLGIIAFCIVLERGNNRAARLAGQSAVHAIQADIPPNATNVHSITPYNIVKVPLTNGEALYVYQCPDPDISAGLVEPHGDVDIAFQQAYKRDKEEKHGCRYFDDPQGKLAAEFEGRLAAVPLGNPNQVAIERDYWVAYKAGKQLTKHHILRLAGYAGLKYGFPAGFGLWCVWCLYRLVRFAIVG